MLERKKGGRKKLRPSIEEFDAFYKDHSAKETAEHFGCKSTYTIYRWASEMRKELENGEYQTGK